MVYQQIKQAFSVLTKSKRFKRNIKKIAMKAIIKYLEGRLNSPSMLSPNGTPLINDEVLKKITDK